MNRCVSEPISWLRLERYGLGQVSSGEREAITSHLATCPACRACLEHMEHSAPALRLPLPAAKKRRVWPKRWALRDFGSWALVAGGALAALVLLARRPETPHDEGPSVKGGELALELVRLGADAKQREPSHFRSGERWKALLSCPVDLSGYAQLVVFQDAEVYLPLDALHIEHCGNRLTLPGAFALSGTSPVRVCVVLSAEPLTRASLADRATLPDPHVCSEILPSP